jgi:hypothetical protein
MGNLRMQGMEQQLDPFFKFNQAIELGIIPPNMPYADFMQIGKTDSAGTTHAQDMQTFKMLEAEDKKNGTNYAERFGEWKSKPPVIDYGGGLPGQILTGGRARPVTGGLGEEGFRDQYSDAEMKLEK